MARVSERWKSAVKGVVIFWGVYLVLHLIAFSVAGEPNGNLAGYVVMAALVLDEVPIRLLPPGSPSWMYIALTAGLTALLGATLGLLLGAAARNRARINRWKK